MTIEQFNKTRFGNGMKVIYKNEIFPIVAVDFEEALFAIPNSRGIETDSDNTWVRCENVSLVELVGDYALSVPS